MTEKTSLGSKTSEKWGQNDPFFELFLTPKEVLSVMVGVKKTTDF